MILWCTFCCGDFVVYPLLWRFCGVPFAAVFLWPTLFVEYPFASQCIFWSICCEEVPPTLPMMKWCLMSSDVGWRFRDKLRPIPKHGSINLYVHGSQKAREDGQPRKATSTLTQLLNYDPSHIYPYEEGLLWCAHMSRLFVIYPCKCNCTDAGH